LEKNTEIKVKESEMNMELKPYKLDIEQLELQLKEEKDLLESGKKSKPLPVFNGHDTVEMTPNDVEHSQNTIRFLEREIGRKQFEIEKIKEGYRKEIEEIKEKYDVVG
jgi:UDP-3-O-acyl-N-acetylglucosamine deacetylase